MNYYEMFDRNIGVFTQEEQSKLKGKKIGIMGCGGMGGISAQIIARTGIENMILADPEKFEVVNINNQFTAFKTTIGENKAKVTAKMVSAINPKINLEIYDEGLTDKNVENIVKSVNIIFDCIDYNALYYSYILNKSAKKEGKYVLAPQAIGYGASVLVFDPNSLSFNEYMGLNDNMSKEQIDNFIVAPDKYAPIIPSYIDKDIMQKVVNKSIPIPNIALAQTLATSIMVSEAIIILLNKRKPITVPNVIAIDLLENKYLS